MGKTLVLTEKPSVARDIAKFLNCNQNSNGCMLGNEYIVTWALGHLVTLAEPETYNEKYKIWNLEDLPMLPKKMELVVIKETSKQFGIVKSLMHRVDVDELVIATDSGREGELVARWIIEKAGFNKPIKRLWISSQTDKAIKDGFASLKPSKDYDNLYLSAKSRSEADWLVGLNVTRALTCKYNAQLSAGRVQTPTLAMIVERENLIRNFIPKDYWSITANFNGFTLLWRAKVAGQTRIFNKEQADNIVSVIVDQIGEVTEVRKDAKKEPHPLAYDLTELQRDANRRYGYSAKQTLNIMQKLYETHKLVTYPRTDSRYITDDIISTLTDRLKSIAVGPYAKLVHTILRSKIVVTKRFVDNSKVTDHHAIIPTEHYVNLVALNSEERNIYDLIVKRFIAVLNPPFEYEQTTIKVDINGEAMYAKGKIVKSWGWKSVYEGFGELDEDEEEEEEEEEEKNDNDQSLPDVRNGQKGKIISLKSTNGKTRPLARYNEATLLSAMEHPGKLVENKAFREALESTSGLGTSATRADIIEKLFSTFYVERRGKEIFPTSKGIQLIGIVPSDLKSPELTGKWEQQLSLIAKGEVNASTFVSEMKNYAIKLVGTVISSAEVFKHDNITREKCECGKYLLDVRGKRGAKMLVCPDRECGYRKTISQTSNARCPECHKKMELRGEGENKFFICTCGYREKLEVFKKRKGERVNKKEVSEFLKKQDGNEPMNSGFADGLSNWKMDK